MGKRYEFERPFCHKCQCGHPKDQHLAKPRRAVVDLTPKERFKQISGIARKKVKAAVAQAVDQEAQKIMDGTSKLYPAVGDLTEDSLVDLGATIRTTPGATRKLTHVVYPLSNSPENLTHPLDNLARDLKDGTLEHVLKGGVPGDKKYNELKAAADGVALKSTAHPRGRKKTNQDICMEALETMSAPPSVVAEIERLGPKEIAKRKADKKKRTKAEVLELVDAELARQRALRAARQARYRAKLKKPKRKKKRKAKK